MRVLVATAVTLLVMMMSRACVANPATTDLELEDDEGFDLINVAQNQDENDLVDQLANVEAEVADSSTFQPTVFGAKCHHVYKNTGECESSVMFNAMGKTYNMTVRVRTYFVPAKNQLYLYLFINNKCISYKIVSAAEDKPQTNTVDYKVGGILFRFSITSSRMFSDMTHSGTRSCSRVEIWADNKRWAKTQRGCHTFAA